MNEYYISIAKWDETKKEYTTKAVYQSYNYERAKNKFEQMEVSVEIPMIELYQYNEETGDEIRLNHKVCLTGLITSEGTFSLENK